LKRSQHHLLAGLVMDGMIVVTMLWRCLRSRAWQHEHSYITATLKTPFSESATTSLPDLVVRHRGLHPVIEYNNPDLIPDTYPTLFPFGIRELKIIKLRIYVTCLDCWLQTQFEQQEVVAFLKDCQRQWVGITHPDLEGEWNVEISLMKFTITILWQCRTYKLLVYIY
jgi:hypothetical protein